MDILWVTVLFTYDALQAIAYDVRPSQLIGDLVSELIFFILLMALWLWIAWAIFRRVGFFGGQKPPRFSLTKDGVTYDSRRSRYLINGIVGGRHLVFVFETPEGTPFVYHPRDRDVQVLGGAEGLQSFVRDHCGGEKGLQKLREARLARAR